MEIARFLDIEDAKCLLVTCVEENSPAAHAGLEWGDLIVGVNGSVIRSLADLERIFSDAQTAPVITLRILRCGAPRELSVRR